MNLDDVAVRVSSAHVSIARLFGTARRVKLNLPLGCEAAGFDVSRYLIDLTLVCGTLLAFSVNSNPRLRNSRNLQLPSNGKRRKLLMFEGRSLSTTIRAFPGGARSATVHYLGPSPAAPKTCHLQL